MYGCLVLLFSTARRCSSVLLLTTLIWHSCFYLYICLKKQYITDAVGSSFILHCVGIVLLLVCISVKDIGALLLQRSWQSPHLNSIDQKKNLDSFTAVSLCE